MIAGLPDRNDPVWAGREDPGFLWGRLGNFEIDSNSIIIVQHNEYITALNFFSLCIELNSWRPKGRDENSQNLLRTLRRFVIGFMICHGTKPLHTKLC